ncbi:MAG: methyltransferase domain-containing protein [Chloroflexota bacterium]|nr:methyltransferase domain-containing protein [Chloroflexota bacterium]
MTGESIDTHKLVQEQFGAVASAYTVSAGHSDKDALQRVVELAKPVPSDVALDIATGAGHVALALAPHVAQVTAYDLTPQMLEETAHNAAARGLHNLTTQEGAAESLPYRDSSFEIVTCRIAPHHFADIQKAVDEMARVLKPGGRVVVVDTTVPESETEDRQINYIEWRRDPSHVRNYPPGEWRSIFEKAGLQVTYLEAAHPPQEPLSFADWTTRMRTPPDAAEEIAGLLRSASPALQKALKVEIKGPTNEDIYFTLLRVTIVGEKKLP